MFYCKSCFCGGYVFRNFQGTPQLETQTMPAPQLVLLPLGIGIEPKVAVGKKVMAGEIIGQDQAQLLTPVFASISGTVKEIADMVEYGQTVKAIVIESNGQQEAITLPSATSEWQKLTPKAMSSIFIQSGVSGLGANGLPTLGKTNRLDARQVKYLVVSALATYPMAPKTSATCENRLAEAAQGVAILKHFYGNPATYIGYSKKEPDVGKALKSALANSNITIRGLSPRYPQEFPEILTSSLTGQVVPDGLKADAIGAVVVSLADALAVYDAVVVGRPCISKMVALCGTGFAKNLLVKVRLGTPLSEILTQYGRPDHVEKRLLRGTALLGEVATPTTPIGIQDNCITYLEEERHRQFFAFLRPGLRADSYSNTFVAGILPLAKKAETNLHGEGRPCIHCGYCENVCPRPLYPHLLHKYCTHDLAEDALQLRLKACIECGLCSYVCPSKISILSDIQKGKKELREAGLMA